MNNTKELATQSRDFKQILAKVEKSKGKTLLEHFLYKCYSSEICLIAYMKKILPDLTKHETSQINQTQNIYISGNTNNLLEQISNKMREARQLEVKRAKKVE